MPRRRLVCCCSLSGWAAIALSALPVAAQAPGQLAPLPGAPPAASAPPASSAAPSPPPGALPDLPPPAQPAAEADAALGNVSLGAHHVLRVGQRGWLSLGGGVGLATLSGQTHDHDGYEPLGASRGYWDLHEYFPTILPIQARVSAERHLGPLIVRGQVDPILSIPIGRNDEYEFALQHAAELQLGHSIGGGGRVQGVALPTFENVDVRHAGARNLYVLSIELFFVIERKLAFLRTGLMLPFDEELGPPLDHTWGFRLSAGVRMECRPRALPGIGPLATSDPSDLGAASAGRFADRVGDVPLQLAVRQLLGVHDDQASPGVLRQELEGLRRASVHVARQDDRQWTKANRRRPCRRGVAGADKEPTPRRHSAAPNQEAGAAIQRQHDGNPYNVVAARRLRHTTMLLHPCAIARPPIPHNRYRGLPKSKNRGCSSLVSRHAIFWCIRQRSAFTGCSEPAMSTGG
jgi:hypothetical protein